LLEEKKVSTIEEKEKRKARKEFLCNIEQYYAYTFFLHSSDWKLSSSIELK